MYIRDTGPATTNQLRTYLRAPFGALVQILGPPDKQPPEKCSTIWNLRYVNRVGEQVSLQDLQDGDDPSFNLSAFRALPSHDWHVWAPDEEAAARFCRWLSPQVMDAVAKVRRLDDAGKTRLNELLRAGVPLNEAMKSITLVQQNVADFAWPIPSGRPRARAR